MCYCITCIYWTNISKFWEQCFRQAGCCIAKKGTHPCGHSRCTTKCVAIWAFFIYKAHAFSRWGFQGVRTELTLPSSAECMIMLGSTLWKRIQYKSIFRIRISCNIFSVSVNCVFTNFTSKDMHDRLPFFPVECHNANPIVMAIWYIANSLHTSEIVKPHTTYNIWLFIHRAHRIHAHIQT